VAVPIASSDSKTPGASDDNIARKPFHEFRITQKYHAIPVYIEFATERLRGSYASRTSETPDAPYAPTTAMPLPKLSPLQSRLAASLIASVTLLLLYFAFVSPQFAYAADVDSIRPEDHNHERLLGGPFLEFDFEKLELREASYEAEFVGVDRGIIGRATADPTTLTNNVMQQTNIQQGQLVSYMFSNASLWGPLSPINSGLPSQINLNGKIKRSIEDTESLDDTDDNEETEDGEELKLKPRQSILGGQRHLYITVTACKQPVAISSTTINPPPQLQLYVSQSKNNTAPGPGQSPQDEISLVGGYALYQVNATGDVYIGIYGPNVNTTYSDVWNAQIAASIDEPYHYFWNSTDPNLFLVDSDDNSALLYTDPLILDSSNTTLYDEWMDITPPFTVFASDANDNSILGLQNSYCGLQTKAQISASQPGQTSSKIQTGMISIGNGSLPKQQFYLTGLGAGKTYNIALAMNGTTASGNSAVGAGGQVFTMTNFTTLSGTLISSS
jgi:calcium channel MID1